jgi:hypothetical protein
MNCLDFRRELAAVPEALGGDALAHEADCTRCAQARGDALAFEAKLRGALAVAVPASLADEILLRQTTEARRERSRRNWRTSWRIAAVLVVALAGGMLWRMQASAPSLSRLAVAHLPGEPGALTARGNMPFADVRTFFATRGVALRADPGEVDYLMLCELGPDPAVHMVVQAPAGPVTVFYVAGRHEAARAGWQSDGMVGRTVPVSGGTLVLVAAHAGDFDPIERRWTQALDEDAGTAVAQL